MDKDLDQSSEEESLSKQLSKTEISSGSANHIQRAVQSAPGSSTKSTNSDINFPEIIKTEVKLHEELGRGACGKVYRGICRGKEVAVKVLNNKLGKNDLDKFKDEVSIMARLRHPKIVLFMGACVDPCYIVSEYLPNGDLEQLITGTKEVTTVEALLLAKDIAEGMNWLHCSIPPIIHKDLKPANILVCFPGIYFYFSYFCLFF
eukprot:TRINITY_DN1461_c1_g2_i6.p1 TRINITY_DN1461_c1_g2~~TRINITY_DN1461_c1_g2_i6.p1  ORF type:complete len:204 (-),score=26.12 TRINITY_DN1461_c1_g2_i6:260-871(-)